MHRAWWIVFVCESVWIASGSFCKHHPSIYVSPKPFKTILNVVREREIEIDRTVASWRENDDEFGHLNIYVDQFDSIRLNEWVLAVLCKQIERICFVFSVSRRYVCKECEICGFSRLKELLLNQYLWVENQIKCVWNKGHTKPNQTETSQTKPNRTELNQTKLKPNLTQSKHSRPNQ